MASLRASEYEAILGIVAGAARDPGSGLTLETLEAIRRLIPNADTVAFFMPPELDHSEVFAGETPQWTSEDRRILAAFKDQDPLQPSVAALGRSRRATELMSRAVWRRTDLYNLVGRRHGLEYSMNVWHRSAGDHWWGLWLDTGRRDFSDRDLDVLDVLSRYLAVVLDRAGGRGHADGESGLTRRQIEILDLVARGLTNDAIAMKLALSTHTVRKHLELAFDRLDVHTRAAAVARAVELGLVEVATRARPTDARADPGDRAINEGLVEVPQP